MHHRVHVQSFTFIRLIFSDFRHPQQHIDFGQHNLGAIGHDAFSPPIFCPSPVSLPLLWPWLRCLPHGTEELVRCTLCSVWHGFLHQWSLASSRLHKVINTEWSKQWSIRAVCKVLKSWMAWKWNLERKEPTQHNAACNCEFQNKKRIDAWTTSASPMFS